MPGELVTPSQTQAKFPHPRFAPEQTGSVRSTRPGKSPRLAPEQTGSVRSTRPEKSSRQFRPGGCSARQGLVLRRERAGSVRLYTTGPAQKQGKRLPAMRRRPLFSRPGGNSLLHVGVDNFLCVLSVSSASGDDKGVCRCFRFPGHVGIS